MNDVAKIIEGLSPRERRALLAKLMAQRVAKPKTAPMSFAQERMWFLDRFQPGLSVYNIPHNFFAPSPVNERLLKRVFEEIIRRHETLRTTFRDGEEGPVQVIAPPAPISIKTHDLRDLDEEERQQKLHRLIADETAKPFDLKSGPLIRIGLAHVSQDHAYVLMTLHHIVTDGWSMPIFSKEFETLYHAFQEDRPSPLPELSLQYADFARWQREWLKGPVLEKQLKYWKTKLAGIPEVLEFPFDRPRSPHQTFEGGCQNFRVPSDCYKALLSISRGKGATLFMTMLAAFKILLQRLSGQKDIVIGIPVANRTRSEIEGLIGLFVNTLVLRANLRNDPSFSQVLDQVRETSLEALSHQDLPFEKLVEELQPERNMSYNPLFQVSLHIQALQGEGQDPPMPEPDLSQPPPTPAVSLGTAKFDINLVFWEGGGRLIGALEYSTMLFDHPTIARLIVNFLTLLKGVVANPNQPISKLPVMAEWEYKQLADWSPDPETLEDRPVHRLLENQARETPDAPALESPNGVMNFAALNRKADRLAHLLREKGVQARHQVGVCLDRSADMVVATLAVLKAGAVLAPIEPTDPSACVARVLAHAPLSLIVSRAGLTGCLPEQRPEVLYLEKAASKAASDDHVRLDSAIDPDDGVYLSFTSRSEAACRGALLTHRQLSFSIQTLLDRLEPRAAKRVLQNAPLAVPTALLEIFYALLSGQTLVLPGADAADEEAPPVADIAFCSPSLLTFPPNGPPAVKVLAVSREAAPYDAAIQWPQDFSIFEYYCGDEVLIGSRGAFFDKSRKPSLGAPIPGAPAYVMDNRLQPMPIGTQGLLCIGGAALPRGYHGQPDLTAARFTPDPLAKCEGARLFISQDLVRVHADGNLEYRGQTGRRFRRRGIMVDPEEIERLLLGAPNVTEACALPTPNTGLTVFLVGSQPLNAAELSDYLAQRLPRDSGPDHFVFLDQMPLLATGEVDRAALVHAVDDAAIVSAPPETPLEKVLAEIWIEVLDTPGVGLQDNFFLLGGHSLLVNKVISRVRDALGVELPIRAIFDAPTISGLALFLTEQPDSERVLKTAELLVKLAEMEDSEVENLLDQTPSS